MDLGTANTIIMHNDKIVVNEPSIVALDNRTDKMVAVGNQAKMMYEKTNKDIRVVRPLRRSNTFKEKFPLEKESQIVQFLTEDFLALSRKF